MEELQCLGFQYKITESESDCEVLGQRKSNEMLSLSLVSKFPELKLENLTIVFTIMYFSVLKSRCIDCAKKAFKRLDFTDIEENLDEADIEFIYSCLEFEDKDDEPDAADFQS